MKNKNGSALVIVMCVAGLMLLMGLSITFLTGNRSYSVRKLTNKSQALAIAEAGVADMLSKLQEDYIIWMDGSNSANFGEGKYSVISTFNPANANITITSTAIVENDKCTTILEIIGDIDSIYNRSLGINGVMLAGGNITLDTGAINVNGDIHANGSILHSSGNTTIDGNASACGVNELNFSTGYTNIAGVSPIIIPDYRPFNEWEALAKSNGLYYATSQSFPMTNLRPANGVVYVNGDVSFANRSSLVGTLVASGKITFNNQFTHISFNTNWPALLAGGDIELNNRDNFYGIIFAGGNIKSKNRKEITGAFIAIGNIYAENNLNLSPLGYYPAWRPDDTNNVAPAVLVGGWLK